MGLDMLERLSWQSTHGKDKSIIAIVMLELKPSFLVQQPDLDLNVATIHKHLLLWAIISKTKLIWSISLTVLEKSNKDS